MDGDKRLKIAVYIVLCMGAAVYVCASIGFWPLRAAPINSQVVDEGTRAPIEGAIVVAYWELNSGSIGGGSLPCGAANVEEAVTDKDGLFHMPGWGPTWPTCHSRMNVDAPMMFVFKSGYDYGKFINGPGGNVYTTTTTRSAWNKQMPLRRFSSMDLTDRSARGYTAHIASLNIELGLFVTYLPGECNWKKMPSMLRALEMQRQAISNAVGYPIDGITVQLIDDDSYFQKIAPQCGSPKAFIEGLMNENTSQH